MNGLKGPYLWLLAIPLLIGLGSSQRSSAQDTLPKEVVRFADVVLFNGKVLTADQDFTIAEALAIRDGKIMAAGSSASISRMADQNTRRIDLEGRTVILGVIDNHAHLFNYALDRWGDELEDLEPNLQDFRPRTIQAESAEDFLAKLENLMASIRWTQVVVIIQEPMKSLAHVYRKEMEVWASKGVTTWSSQLIGLVDLNVYSQLDRNGAMPMRFGYSHAMGDNGWPASP